MQLANAHKKQNREVLLIHFVFLEKPDLWLSGGQAEIFHWEGGGGEKKACLKREGGKINPSG